MSDQGVYDFDFILKRRDLEVSVRELTIAILGLLLRFIPIFDIRLLKSSELLK